MRGRELVAEARAGDERALQAFREYGARLAYFLYSMVMVFAPESIVISGGFSNAYELFLNVTNEHLLDLLKNHRVGVDMLPKLKISKFRDEAGVLGAAYVALSADH